MQWGDPGAPQLKAWGRKGGLHPHSGPDGTDRLPYCVLPAAQWAIGFGTRPLPPQLLAMAPTDVLPSMVRPEVWTQPWGPGQFWTKWVRTPPAQALRRVVVGGPGQAALGWDWASRALPLSLRFPATVNWAGPWPLGLGVPVGVAGAACGVLPAQLSGPSSHGTAFWPASAGQTETNPAGPARK